MLTFHFDKEIAIDYGVECAVMIWNLQYWIEHNAANGKHFYNGRTWTYNSAEAFTAIFPFWSKGQVRRILKALEERGVIMTGNFNEDARNRTTWYAFTDEFQHLHFSKSTNASVENEKCNNNSNKDKDSYISDIKNADGVPAAGVPSTPPAKVRKMKRTSEPLCLFADSRYSDYDVFQREFVSPEFECVDLFYYFNAVADWSARGGKKQKDWIATARSFMRRDERDGKLRKVKPAGVELPPDAIEYLKMMGR